GSNLEIWKMKEQNIISKTFGIRASSEEKTMLFPPQISGYARIESAYSAVAFSDGSIRIVDLNAPMMIKIFKEHNGTIRSVINLSTQYFATGSDDQTIKIWDLREQRSALTIGGNPGKVTALLKIDDTQFISGISPSNSLEKPSIAFWDLRKLLSNG
nr:hypothetical protein [Chlamydiota bacterium]